jgi:hypothetical protein
VTSGEIQIVNDLDTSGIHQLGSTGISDMALSAQQPPNHLNGQYNK